ncbi:hypothetical protein [Nocardia altamirensis]|uniref:hypothetical protein n=1 Tax=Nocardia altamirensis TaxID=472158 RepID=UPI00083FF460|nr:hypothetical protein [Nocardia altamirensis]
MWNWSKSVAERAAAAAWTSWRNHEPRPTILDPEYWQEDDDRDSDPRDEDGMSAQIFLGGFCLVG